MSNPDQQESYFISFCSQTNRFSSKQSTLPSIPPYVTSKTYQFPSQHFYPSCYNQDNLHHIPCNLNYYEDLSPNLADYYRLDKGLLIWKGNMPSTSNHDEIMASYVSFGTWLHDTRQADIIVRSRASFKPSDRRSTKATEKLSKNISLSSESSSEDLISGPLEPDVAFGGCTPNNSPNRHKYTFTSSHPPKLAIEITSKSNRHNDLTEKWVKYANSGIPEYVIADLQTGCIIVGKLKGDGPKTYTADPSLSDYDAKRRMNHPELYRNMNGQAEYSSHATEASSSQECRLYHRKIYRGQQLVDASYFNLLNVTADFMLNPPKAEIFRREKADAERQVKNWLRQQKIHERNLRLQAEQEREKAEHKREQAEHKREQAEHKREQAEYERDQERKKRLNAERRIKELEAQVASTNYKLQTTNRNSKSTVERDTITNDAKSSKRDNVSKSKNTSPTSSPARKRLARSITNSQNQDQNTSLR